MRSFLVGLKLNRRGEFKRMRGIDQHALIRIGNQWPNPNGSSGMAEDPIKVGGLVDMVKRGDRQADATGLIGQRPALISQGRLGLRSLNGMHRSGGIAKRQLLMINRARRVPC